METTSTSYDAMSVCYFMTTKFDGPTPKEFDDYVKQHPKYKITDRCALGCTALDRAAHGRNPQILNHLIQKTGAVSLVTMKGYTGTQGEQESCVKGYYLIRNEVEKLSSPLQQALHAFWSCKVEGHLRCAQLLLEHGASREDLKTPLVVEAAKRANNKDLNEFLRKESASTHALTIQAKSGLTIKARFDF